MGVRFSKQIKLGSLLKLNISKSGVSLSAGKKGASINLGKNGTYLNLSPSALGISGTGLSYRQKITGGYGTAIKKLANKDSTVKKADSKLTKQEDKEETATSIDTSVIDQYNENYEANVNIHKYTDDVIDNESFAERIKNFDNEGSKEIYQLLIDGDEDTIESAIGAFLNNLDLNYEVKCNYELEDKILYVDLDLPEIEDFSDEYPTIVKNAIVNKKKTNAQLKEEYAKTILSLGVYLTANFFNISSYIETVVLSAFTTKRNNDGDLVDEYLYSVKYTKDKFLNKKLAEIEDVYKFMLNFENRINLSANYSFKAIKAYESESVVQTNSMVEDAISGLKELGYKASDIERILPQLNELKLTSAGEYIKEALKLLAK